MDTDTGVTVNTALTVNTNLQVAGSTALNGTLQVDRVPVPKILTRSFTTSTGTRQTGYSQNNNAGQTWYMTEHPVSFPSGTFSSTPKVFVNQTAGNSWGHATISRIYAINVTASGFTTVVSDYSGDAGVRISWMAVGT